MEKIKLFIGGINMKMNYSMSVGYEKLQKKFEDIEQGNTIMHFARMGFFDAFSHLHRGACSEEEKNLLESWK